MKFLHGFLCVWFVMILILAVIILCTLIGDFIWWKPIFTYARSVIENWNWAFFRFCLVATFGLAIVVGVTHPILSKEDNKYGGYG